MRILFASLICISLYSCQAEKSNIKITGSVFGTSYSVIYASDLNYQDEFESIFGDINQSMSTYIPDSDISRINRNEVVNVDEHFINVLNSSRKIFKETAGIFDPTIGAVVNAWDFGPEGKIEALDSVKIAQLMPSVGLDKVKFENGVIIKPELTFLDFNAIAKGYAVDVIGEFLEEKGIEDYLVEIGGEIRTRGTNAEKNAPWLVGIDKPNFDGSQSIFSRVSLGNAAMATSGTYRKFRTDSLGNRYAHIIDTNSGYPTTTNILSVSVIANTCMDADAYATAFQAMGTEGVRTFLSSRPEVKAFLIIGNSDQQLESININNFPEN